MGSRGSGSGKSSGGGARINKSQELLEKIDDLPAFLGDDTQTKNLVTVAATEDVKETKALYRAKKQNNSLEYKNETMNIKDLETEQIDLYKENLRAIAKTTSGEIAGWSSVKNPTSKTDTGIRAIRHNGHTIIYDGNHRVNIAILRGQKRIKLRVAEV